MKNKQLPIYLVGIFLLLSIRLVGQINHSSESTKERPLTQSERLTSLFDGYRSLLSPEMEGFMGFSSSGLVYCSKHPQEDPTFLSETLDKFLFFSNSLRRVEGKVFDSSPTQRKTREEFSRTMSFLDEIYHYQKVNLEEARWNGVFQEEWLNLRNTLSKLKPFRLNTTDKEQAVVNWKDIQSSLNYGQVAIQVVRINRSQDIFTNQKEAKVLFDENNSRSRNREDSAELELERGMQLTKNLDAIFSLADSIRYLAFIIHAEPSKDLELVVFGEGNELESTTRSKYISFLQQRIPPSSARQDSGYDAYFAPIAARLSEHEKELFFVGDQQFSL